MIMWQYNNTPEPDELYHHGIKGMKWGQRRYQNQDGSLTPAGKKRYNTDVERNFAEKKATYKAANKAYNKSFSKAYNRAIAAYSPSKKHRQANEERWKDVADKVETLRTAKSEYKAAKSEYKTAKKAAKEQRGKEYVDKNISAERNQKKVKTILFSAAGAATLAVGVAAVKTVKDANYVLDMMGKLGELG